VSHRHAPWQGDVTCTEIDEHVCLRPIVHGGDPDVTNADGTTAGGPDEHLAGFIVAYDWPGSEWRLEGAVSVDPHLGERATWSMTGSLEGGDLTLSPSIQAYDHRDGRTPTIHGFVRDGKWVPA
jgi:hypothetical protein